jgi:hypothetical protein
MSNQDLKKTLDAVDALTKEVTSSKEKALDFLVRAGFVTPSGELTPQYRQGA